MGTFGDYCVITSCPPLFQFNPSFPRCLADTAAHKRVHGSPFLLLHLSSLLCLSTQP